MWFTCFLSLHLSGHEASAPPPHLPQGKYKSIKNCLYISVNYFPSLTCRVDNFYFLIWYIHFYFFLLAPTMGHGNPEPKTRGELLKCESIILHNMKPNIEHSVKALWCTGVFTKMNPLSLVRFEPTMDPNTVYRHVQLSDRGHKATMRAENLNPPDHPERFQFWRQVLCREPLAGSPYYWEVEWTGQKVDLLRYQWIKLHYVCENHC